MRALSRSIVRYYVALRLSAGAAAAFLPVDLPREPEAIVRMSKARSAGELDPREVIHRATSTDVITVPFDHASRDRSVIGLN